MTKTDDAESNRTEPPELDDDLVARVVGKRLLIGLTYVNYRGELIKREQFHGIVEQISRQSGIVMRLPDGSEYRLPPDLRGIQDAPPGTYRLRSTGEEVENLTSFSRGPSLVLMHKLRPTALGVIRCG